MEISRVIQNIRDFRTGSLMIVGMPALASKLLSYVITEFTADHPGISVSLHTRSSHTVLRHHCSQQFDIGFAALDKDHPAVVRRALFTAPMLGVLPLGYELEQKILLEPGALNQRPFIALAQKSEPALKQVCRSTDPWLAAPSPMTEINRLRRAYTSSSVSCSEIASLEADRFRIYKLSGERNSDTNESL